MKKGKAVFKWICTLGGGMLVLLLVLGGGFYWMAGRPLAKRLAELRKAGEPVCLKDIERELVPANENGVTFLLQAKPEIEAFEKATMDLKYLPAGKISPEDKAKIHQFLEDHPNILPLIQKAAAAPDCQFLTDYSVKPQKYLSDYLPLIQFQRECLRYLKAKTEDQLEQGKREEAMQTIFLMFQLVRQYKRDRPILIGYLVCNACKGIAMDCSNEVLQAGDLSQPTHEALEAELVKLDSLQASREAMKIERAYCLDTLQNEMPGYLPLAQWQLAALDMFDDYFKYSNLPYSTGASKMNAPSRTTFSILSGPVSQMLPACKATLEAAIRCQAAERSLRIINALQRKEIAGDKIPSMEELGLPKEVGIDPFNGQPMIIKKTPEGWLVYSIGKNLRDDGGDLSNSLDVGFGPKKYMEEQEVKEVEANKTSE